MEYLSKKKGWERTFIGDKPDSIFCNYIEKFVSKTGLINIKDPQAHFYYNDKKDKDNLYMIDYGNCEECGIPYGKYGDGSGTFKCLDHDHHTGKFRNFICHGCNLRRGHEDRANLQQLDTELPSK